MWGDYGTNKSYLEEMLLKLQWILRTKRTGKESKLICLQNFLKDNRDYVHEKRKSQTLCNVGNNSFNFTFDLFVQTLLALLP